MGTYRQSRAIEASIIDQITEQLLADGWVGIQTIKSFTEVYKNPLPAICINVQEIRPEKLEIGSKTNLKFYVIYIRIFGTSDGNRLDLSDWLFNLLEDDFLYYSYTITNGEVSSKILTGRIVITRWLDNRKELTNSENLEKEDKYRHLLSYECIVAE